MLYYVGQRSQIFNMKQFLYWFFLGCAHAVVVFTIPYFVYEYALLTKDFYNNDMWSFSVTSFTAVIIVRLDLLIV